MPFVFSMEETVLPSLPLVLVFVPVPTLDISLAFGLFLGRVVWTYLPQLLPLLVVSSLFYVALLGISTVALELLALVLFF